MILAEKHNWLTSELKRKKIGSHPIQPSRTNAALLREGVHDCLPQPKDAEHTALAQLNPGTLARIAAAAGTLARIGLFD